MPNLPTIPWHDVDSSNLSATYYDERTATLCVRFKDGSVYSYIAPHEAYIELSHSSSMGSYLHYMIKPLPTTRWETEYELLEHLNAA